MNKSRRDFVHNPSRRDSLSSYCRSCIYKYNVQREARLRTAALVALGGECARCEISDFRILDIDHIHGGGSQERKSGLRQAKFYLHVVSNLDRFQLLCKNCNWIKYLEGDNFVAPSYQTVTGG
jgi:hypothetical protein